jgi:heterodisulfide reductase subunit A-like polyferredoxin
MLKHLPLSREEPLRAEFPFVARLASERHMDNPARPLILRAMEHDSDLLIVGGGLNGPALALAAARAGLSATVIDALPLSARS